MSEVTKTLPGSPSTPSSGSEYVFLQAGHTISLLNADAVSPCCVHSFKHTRQNVCKQGKALGSVIFSLQMPHLVRSSAGVHGEAMVSDINFVKRRENTGSMRILDQNCCNATNTSGYTWNNELVLAHKSRDKVMFRQSGDFPDKQSAGAGLVHAVSVNSFGTDVTILKYIMLLFDRK